MIARRCSHNLIACATVLFASLAVHLDVRAADPSAPEAGDPGKILVEIFLALDRTGDLDAIEQEFGRRVDHQGPPQSVFYSTALDERQSRHPILKHFIF